MSIEVLFQTTIHVCMSLGLVRTQTNKAESRFKTSKASVLACLCLQLSSQQQNIRGPPQAAATAPYCPAVIYFFPFLCSVSSLPVLLFFFPQDAFVAEFFAVLFSPALSVHACICFVVPLLCGSCTCHTRHTSNTTILHCKLQH